MSTPFCFIRSLHPGFRVRRSFTALLVLGAGLLSGISAFAEESENVRHVPVSFSAESDKYTGDLIVERAGHLLTEDAWVIGFSMKDAQDIMATENLVIYVDADLGETPGRESIGTDYFIDVGKRQFSFANGEELQPIGGVKAETYEDTVYVIVDRGLMELPFSERFNIRFSVTDGELSQRASVKVDRDQTEETEVLSPPLDYALSPPRKYEVLSDSENGIVWNANLAPIGPSDRPGELVASSPLKLISARAAYEPLEFVPHSQPGIAGSEGGED